MEQVDKSSLAMFRKALSAAKRRSTKKGVPFDITMTDIADHYTAQLGLCYYSGMEMNIVKRSESLHDPYKMTIDCKDQALGYTRANIVLCSYCVNSFKQKMPYEEMLEICRKIIDNDHAKD